MSQKMKPNMPMGQNMGQPLQQMAAPQQMIAPILQPDNE
jgi:hypothetical protein